MTFGKRGLQAQRSLLNVPGTANQLACFERSIFRRGILAENELQDTVQDFGDDNKDREETQ